jgi:ribonuclease HI
MTTLKLYTDGACANNQGDVNFGGWGAILEYGEHVKELYGGEANTTNNRMELKAVIEGFKALKKEGLEVEVFSDSSYVMNCFRDKWYVNWQKNGWKNSKKEPVENRELWEELIALAEKHKVSFYRVKGHVSVEKSTEAALGKLYEKFVEWNGAKFSYDDFLYVTEQNNRADELANIGIDEVRE